MAITPKTAVEVATSSASTSHTINAPSDVAAGDVLVLNVAFNGSPGTITLDASWVPITALISGASNPQQRGWYRVWHTGDPTTWTLTTGGSVTSTQGVMGYSGVDNTTPLDVTATTNSYGSTDQATVTGLAVVTATDGAMIIGAAAANSTSVTFTPNQLTERYDSALATKANTLGDQLQAASGSSGDKTWTLSSARAWSCWLCALRPVAAGAKTIAVATVTDTSAPGAIRRTQIRTVAQVTEPNTATALVKKKQKALGTVQNPNVATSIFRRGARKYVAVGTAYETEATFAITRKLAKSAVVTTVSDTNAPGLVVRPTAGPTPFPSSWHVVNGDIFDEANTSITPLRGFSVHVASDPATRNFCWPQTDFDAMRAAGANLIRLILHWDCFEPSQGTIDATALATLDTAIARAKQAHLYVLLDAPHCIAGRYPAWATGDQWTRLQTSGQTFIQTLATRYASEKTVVGLNPNEPPSDSISTITTGYQTIVAWYRDICPHWPIWCSPFGYGGGSPTPRSPTGGVANADTLVALDTHSRGVILEWHDYLNLAGSYAADSYMNNGLVDPIQQVGATGGQFHGWGGNYNYPNTNQSRIDFANHIASIHTLAASKSQFAFAVGEFGMDSVQSGEPAFGTDKATLYHDNNAVIQLWWNYDTAAVGSNGFSSRPGGAWRTGVTNWLTYSPSTLPPSSGYYDVYVFSDPQADGGNTSRMQEGFDAIRAATASGNSWVVGGGDYCNAYPTYESQFNSTFNSGGLPAKTDLTVGTHDQDGPLSTAWPFLNAMRAGIMGPSQSQCYRSWDTPNGWHIVHLHAGGSGGDPSYASGSAQYNWLVADLNANKTKPTIIFTHWGRYSNTTYHTDNAGLSNIFAYCLANHHQVELMVSGHVHEYARFARMNNSSAVDAVNGIRCITMCTVGMETSGSLGHTGVEFSAAHTTHGYMRLRLYGDRYDWQTYWLGGNSAQTDSGSQTVRTPLTGGSAHTVATVYETDFAQVAVKRGPKVIAVNPVIEVDRANQTFWFGHVKIINVGTVSEVSTVLAFLATKGAAVTTIGLFPGTDIFPALDLYPEAEAETIRNLRERAPLRLYAMVKTPKGNYYRWGSDESTITDVLGDETHSATMPGGFERCETVLSRPIQFEFDDLAEFSTLTILGVGDMVAWEGRLEQLPRTSGEQMAISPGAVGWQAHLDDNQTIRALYVDIDMTSWADISRGRQDVLKAGGWAFGETSVMSDPDSTQSVVATKVTSPWTTPITSEAWYDAKGVPIGSIYYAWVNFNGTPTMRQVGASTDDVVTSSNFTGNIAGSGPGSGTLTAAGSDKKYGLLQLYYNAAFTGDDGVDYGTVWTALAVYGYFSPALPKRGIADYTHTQGFYASDIVNHAVATWAPKLGRTFAGASTITDSAFVVPQASFIDSPVATSEIIKSVTRFDLQDWAVWEGPLFWWHPPGARGRKWRTRIGPSKLSEAGPQVDRVWNSVVIQFQDRTGVNRTIGPTGSGADIIDNTLTDADPLNPATLAGLTRRALLSMGTNTLEGATKVGQTFLSDQKQLSTAGDASLIGHVEDDHGVIWPAWMVRPGDQISFIDAHDTGYRRIVRTDWSNQDKAQQVTLDSPPQGLQAFLERLNVQMIAG